MNGISEARFFPDGKNSDHERKIIYMVKPLRFSNSEPGRNLFPTHIMFMRML